MIKSADPLKIMEVIESLPWDHNKSPNIYMGNNSDDDVVAAKILSKDAKKQSISGQIAKIRYSDLPKVEQLGNLADLKLPDGAGLFDSAHFTYFYDQVPNILALESNVLAPRNKAFADYLVEKLFNHPTVELDEASFTPIIQGNVIDQVLAMGNVGELVLAVRRDGISEIDAADNKLGTALKAQAEYAPEMEVVGIRLSRKKHKRSGGGGEAFKDRIFGTIRKFLPLFETATVRVEDGHGHLVPKNLLSDKLTHVVTSSEKNISSAAMLASIAEAYSSNASLLRVETQ